MITKENKDCCTIYTSRYADGDLHWIRSMCTANPDHKGILFAQADRYHNMPWDDKQFLKSIKD